MGHIVFLIDGENLEARGGIEPLVKVLQTLALPLGYRASNSANPLIAFEILASQNRWVTLGAQSRDNIAAQYRNHGPEKRIARKDGKELTGLQGTTPGLGNKNAGEIEKQIGWFKLR